MRVIIDTDLGMGVPGAEIDDGFALALAIADPSLQIEAITTVAGNIDVERATILTKEFVALVGADSSIRIHRGAATPLLHRENYRPVTCEFLDAHTENPETGSFAASEIARLALENPGVITLVAIGPLTNVALAFALDPRVATALKEVVVMGGVYLGHTHRLEMPGEFNFWKDPEAAYIVMKSGARLKLVGLDVTQRVQLTREDALGLSESDSRSVRFMADQTIAWLDKLAITHPHDFGRGAWCAMHDPLTVAILSRPEFVTWTPARVNVITNDTRAAGMCVTEFFQEPVLTPGQVNAHIATAVDPIGFKDYLLERVRSL